jgi:hypothetical protein
MKSVGSGHDQHPDQDAVPKVFAPLHGRFSSSHWPAPIQSIFEANAAKLLD